MNQRKISLMAGLLFMAFSILACTMNIGGPDYPSNRIPVSTEAIGDMMNAVGTASMDAANTGALTITLTESEVTSYLANQLQSQAQPVITNPQVYLQNGQIEVYGTAQRGYFLATVYAALTAGIDDQGQLKVTVTQVVFGPIPLPDNMKALITNSIQEAFTGAIGPVATGIRLENISIADGRMTVTGRTK